MSGVAAGGVRGELARSEFLMSRRKIVKGWSHDPTMSHDSFHLITVER